MLRRKGHDGSPSFAPDPREVVCSLQCQRALSALTCTDDAKGPKWDSPGGGKVVEASSKKDMASQTSAQIGSDLTALQPIRSADGPAVRMLGGEVGAAAMSNSRARFAAAHSGRAVPDDESDANNCKPPTDTADQTWKRTDAFSVEIRSSGDPVPFRSPWVCR